MIRRRFRKTLSNQRSGFRIPDSGFRISDQELTLQEGFTGEDEEITEEEDDAPAEAPAAAPAAAALACPFAGTAVADAVGIGGTFVLSTTW